MAAGAQTVEALTCRWLERAVIGLNLCPFAKSVYAKNQVGLVVCEATDAETVLDQLMNELQDLANADPELRDTTLLITPHAFQDFIAFNDFLVLADIALTQLGLAGKLQIASFHPDFRFADAQPDDITNYTNRAPFPILHLLRESSIERAVKAFPEASAIYERNMQVLKDLGLHGWIALGLSPSGATE